MNQWPLDRAAYDTNTPYSSFFLSQVGKAAFVSVLSAVLVLLAIVPGEPLVPRFAARKKSGSAAGLRLPGIRTKEFFSANVIGICLAAAHIGYITVFYIVSRKLGAWAPQDLQYSDIVSTPLPWVSALCIGIYAATSEEFLFRLFAIPYMQRLTKSRWLAVVLPAFAWGFLHSNYPQEPAYIRGIEVGLMGIVAGLVMLRWGIWATLIWHYTVDAFLISTSLLRSHGAYLRVSGAIVGGGALIPLGVAAFFYLSRGGFETGTALLNSAHPIGGPRTEAAPGSAEEPAPEAVSETAPAGNFHGLCGDVRAHAGRAGVVRPRGPRAAGGRKKRSDRRFRPFPGERKRSRGPRGPGAARPQGRSRHLQPRRDDCVYVRRLHQRISAAHHRHPRGEPRLSRAGSLRVLERALFPRLPERRVPRDFEDRTGRCIRCITRWTKKRPARISPRTRRWRARKRTCAIKRRWISLSGNWSMRRRTKNPRAPITPSSGNRSPRSMRRRASRARTSACISRCKGTKFPVTAYS